MLSIPLRLLLRNNVITMRIIWAAMTFAIFVLAGIAYMAPMWSKRTAPQEVPGSMNKWRTILYIAGLVAASASILTRQFMFSDNRVRKELAKDTDPFAPEEMNCRSDKLDPERYAKTSMFKPPEQKILRLSGHLLSSMMVSLMLNETIVVLGAAYSLIWQTSDAVIPFFFGGLVLNLFMFPRPEAILERAAHWVNPKR
ncbi:MAG: hypothetical protein C4576_30360 [Desulfobacteraceae bacterium]|nr:MAG: hypothetical protein C4576_30360 [Desulfobacteraceae bacterium]